jgi:hypothetical protein
MSVSLSLSLSLSLSPSLCIYIYINHWAYVWQNGPETAGDAQIACVMFASQAAHFCCTDALFQLRRHCSGGSLSCLLELFKESGGSLWAALERLWVIWGHSGGNLGVAFGRLGSRLGDLGHSKGTLGITLCQSIAS